jgi:hypothetical protein
MAVAPGEDAVATGEISDLTAQSTVNPVTSLSKPGKSDSTITTLTIIAKPAKSIKRSAVLPKTPAKLVLRTLLPVTKHKGSAGKITNTNQGPSPDKLPRKPKTAGAGKKSAKVTAPKPAPRADSVLGDVVVIDLGDEHDEIDRAATSCETT